MNDYKKYKQIFSLRLAGYLMFNGLRIMRIHHDLKETNKDIYLFEDSDRLSELILEYNNLKSSKEKKNDFKRDCRS